MKRLWIVLLSVILLIGCGGPRDLRVTSDSVMEELLAQPGIVVSEDGGSYELRPFVKLEDMAEAADCVIVAEVEKIWYEQRNGIAMLQMDVLVHEKLQGKLRAGDRVSIDYPGGYITYKDLYEAFEMQDQLSEEDENKVSKMVYEGLPWPEEGNVYVLYINDHRRKDLKGLYEMNSATGLLRLQEDGTYIQQGTEEVYTIKEIDEKCK